MYVEECLGKENVCFEEARRESIKENEKKAVDVSGCVFKKPQSRQTFQTSVEVRLKRLISTAVEMRLKFCRSTAGVVLKYFQPRG